MLKLSRGFTLIELMVTVAIVAIFAAIAIPSYQYFIAKTRESTAREEMLRISERLENYRGRQLTYAGYVPENESSTAGRINIPYGSSATDYDYQIILFDINDSSKTLVASNVGQGWRMVANPSSTKSTALRQAKSLLMDSRGMNCEKQNSTLAITSVNCN